MQISMSVKWKMDYVIKSVSTVMEASSVLVSMATGWLVVSVKVKQESLTVMKLKIPKSIADIDECLEDLGTQALCTASNTYCVNSPGSFSCECVPGYALVGGACQRK